MLASSKSSAEMCPVAGGGGQASSMSSKSHTHANDLFGGPSLRSSASYLCIFRLSLNYYRVQPAVLREILWQHYCVWTRRPGVPSTLNHNWEFPNTGPSYSTLNCRILIIRTPKEGTPSFRKLPLSSLAANAPLPAPLRW